VSESLDAWRALDVAASRSLELAHQALLAGGLPVGSVVRDAAGIVAEGRNHAYDVATGEDPLERTRLAHAEMNALARVDTDADLAGLTIWSTQQPCQMCQAAIDFVGIPSLRVIATDPSDLGRHAIEALDDMWVVLATAMFLVGSIRFRWMEHPTVLSSRRREPEAGEFAVIAATSPAHPLSDGRPLRPAVDVLWTEFVSATEHRHSRRKS
jgi:tRNA(Arg) A34 adenosine deaminase TadA